MATLTPATAGSATAAVAIHARHPFRCSDTKVKCSDYLACSDNSGYVAATAATGTLVPA